MHWPHLSPALCTLHAPVCDINLTHLEAGFLLIIETLTLVACWLLVLCRNVSSQPRTGVFSSGFCVWEKCECPSSSFQSFPQGFGCILRRSRCLFSHCLSFAPTSTSYCYRHRRVSLRQDRLIASPRTWASPAWKDGTGQAASGAGRA